MRRQKNRHGRQEDYGRRKEIQILTLQALHQNATRPAAGDKKATKKSCGEVRAMCIAAALVGLFSFLLPAQDVLVYEAEQVASPNTAWGEDITPVDKWNLWSKDKDADKKWSGGRVLQSPPVTRDRATPEEGAPPLHVVITGVPEGRWIVKIKYGRELAFSVDGKNWQRLSAVGGTLGPFDVKDGRVEFWIDDMFADKNNPGYGYFDTVTLVRQLPEESGVINGDFELGTEIAASGWTWWSRDQKGSATFDSPGKTGKRCVLITYDGERDWAFTNSGRLKVKPGEVWVGSAWMKCEQTDGADLAIVALSQGKVLNWSIGYDGIFGTRDWTRVQAIAVVPEGCDEIYLRFVGSGRTRLWVDGVALQPGKLPAVVAAPKPPVNGWATRRVEEKLDRGMLALWRPDGKVYVGWRLLKSDPPDVGFNVYRAVGRGRATKINREPIVQTTDFVDDAAPRGVELRYFVKPVIAGKEGDASEQAILPTNAEPKPYISVKLNGDHTFQKVGIADLNGDGRYDFVIKQPNYNIDPANSYWQPSPGTYKIEAYLSDGTFLWRRDLGWAIEQGIWYSPFVVYDLDGDGRAEIAVKTGEGDPRDSDGRVRSGPEYLSIWDGMTGKELDRVPWPSRDGFTGANAYNFASRNQLGIAFLDGKTPCLMVARGTYTLMKLEAYQFRNHKLERLWTWDSREEMGRGNYFGQGAHFMHAADVDGDGRDEVILGSCVIDDNGRGLWSTGLGHPDHCYVGDINPLRPGLEIYYGIEPGHPSNSVCLVDAKSGEIIWGISEQTYHVHASGLCSDIDPRYPGMECYSGEHPQSPNPRRRWLHSAAGELIADEKSLDLGLSPRAVYWDADLQREILLGGRIFDFRGSTIAERIEGSEAAWADILGDWREEIIVSLPGELRIYTTTIPAADRRVCLMQDPIYRIDVANLAMGYAQPPMTSYCLSATAPSLNIEVEPGALQPGKPRAGSAYISAPSGQDLRGTLRLTADAPARVTPETAEVRTAAGQVTAVPFTVSVDQPARWRPEAENIAITAELAAAGVELRATTAVVLPWTPPSGIPTVQAEDFTDQGGGSVNIRDDKVGAIGKAISHWDAKGHWLRWKITVPAAGRY
ncbi:MAG: hypothetical protein H5T86_09985, partial [Armatimonadetes bacterium]|nr:hypothetical protein [Armatimonadota bacterium]